MSFFKKVWWIFVMGLSVAFGMFVFAESLNVQVDPDCSGIDDGVVICDMWDGKLVYAECYDGKPLQTIGDNNTWQKNMPLWVKKLEKKEYIKYIDKDIIRLQTNGCAPLTFKTATYTGEKKWAVSVRELPIEFLWVAVGLLVLLIIMMVVRHYKQRRENQEPRIESKDEEPRAKN